MTELTLQWSHRLSAVETSRWLCDGTPTKWAFNGATAFRQWKLGCRLWARG